MRFIVIGNIGSDAGYWVIDENGIHHVGGWGTEKLAEFSAAANILRQAVQLKTPAVAEAAVKSVVRFAEEQIKANVKESGQGATVVLVA
jgi:hypothetical protein